ncbi:archease [Natronocalculus amylovorans]|uniref:Archease n=1 Tax=Natronocalculus amylovorans TaxID=2917812 RepID=A0AAE3FVD2_9EURY|nr:archease [Natronocalculus amylovorans]MCL9816257.1 archease [Natronocalculus amylovorans]NUE03347.1 archease [Halorubraceae archaeon YAN]
MSYTLRSHTADVAVEATADSIGELFAAIADGLTEAMCEWYPENGERFTITCTAERLEGLLYDYLDQLIYERDVREVLPVEHHAVVTEHPEAGTDEQWTITATARGVPFADVVARDIKAVTYSEMTVEERAAGWYGYVVFDV